MTDEAAQWRYERETRKWRDDLYDKLETRLALLDLRDALEKSDWVPDRWPHGDE